MGLESTMMELTSPSCENVSVDSRECVSVSDYGNSQAYGCCIREGIDVVEKMCLGVERLKSLGVDPDVAVQNMTLLLTHRCDESVGQSVVLSTGSSKSAERRRRRARFVRECDELANQQGYCYLQVVRSSFRRKIAAVLGQDPLFVDLLPWLTADTYDKVKASKLYVSLVSQRLGRWEYHLSSEEVGNVGSFPQIAATVVRDQSLSVQVEFGAALDIVVPVVARLGRLSSVQTSFDGDAVFDLPGSCYLRVVRPEKRAAAYRSLGPAPLFLDLLEYLTNDSYNALEAGSWFVDWIGGSTFHLTNVRNGIASEFLAFPKVAQATGDYWEASLQLRFSTDLLFVTPLLSDARLGSGRSDVPFARSRDRDDLRRAGGSGQGDSVEMRRLDGEEGRWYDHRPGVSVKWPEPGKPGVRYVHRERHKRLAYGYGFGDSEPVAWAGFDADNLMGAFGAKEFVKGTRAYEYASQAFYRTFRFSAAYVDVADEKSVAEFYKLADGLDMIISGSAEATMDLLKGGEFMYRVQVRKSMDWTGKEIASAKLVAVDMRALRASEMFVVAQAAARHKIIVIFDSMQRLLPGSIYELQGGMAVIEPDE